MRAACCVAGVARVVRVLRCVLREDETRFTKNYQKTVVNTKNGPLLTQAPHSVAGGGGAFLSIWPTISTHASLELYRNCTGIVCAGEGPMRPSMMRDRQQVHGSEYR